MSKPKKEINIQNLSQQELLKEINDLSKKLRHQENLNFKLKTVYEDQNQANIDKIKELKQEIKEYKEYFTPYTKFFDYVKIRVDKMIKVSKFSYEWELFKKGVIFWENKINGKETGEIKIGMNDLMDFYESED